MSKKKFNWCFIYSGLNGLHLCLQALVKMNEYNYVEFLAVFLNIYMSKTKFNPCFLYFGFNELNLRFQALVKINECNYVKFLVVFLVSISRS